MPEDTNGQHDAFVHDGVTSSTERVSFAITVVGTAGQMGDLEALILAYPLKATVEASLLNKVTGAQDAVAGGKTAAACSKLAGFLGQVADFRTSRKLTAAQATELAADGTRMWASLAAEHTSNRNVHRQPSRVPGGNKVKDLSRLAASASPWTPGVT